MTEGSLLIFCNLVWKMLAWLEIEPATLDLNSQSGAYDLSETYTLLRLKKIFCNPFQTSKSLTQGNFGPKDK